MYAMGQRVAKTLDGSRPGYRGSDMGTVSTSTREATNTQGNMDTSGADYGGGNQGGDSSGPDRSRVSDTQQYNHYEVMNEYNPMKEDMLPGDIPDGFIKPEDAGNLGLNLRPYEQQRVDFLNTPYKPINIPAFIPGSTLINTVGNFIGGIGNKKNSQFFADNVAGKYGYGYDPTQTGSYQKAYERYMKERMAGQVNAYGRPLTESEIRLRDGDSGGGIMDVTVNETIDETTDDTTNEDGSLILRYLHDNPNEVINLQDMGVKDTDEMLQVMLERAKNLYTT